MKRTWPIIAVADVPTSTAWYVTLLSAQENHPGADVFNQILDGDGTILLCLHRWGPSGPHGDHDWPSLADPGDGRVGNGAALIVLYAKDLEGTKDTVVRNGGAIVKEIFSFPGGRRFHFADPSGNELAVWSDGE